MFIGLLLIILTNIINIDGVEISPYNLAADKETHQSSTFSSAGLATPGFSSFAVDRNKGANTYTDRCTHTNEDAGAWWLVSLVDPYLIQRVSITNRSHREAHVLDRLVDFYIRVGNDFNAASFDPESYSLCYHHNHESLGNGTTTEFSCNTPIMGKYVTIHLPKNKTEFLELCEVEVYSDTVTLTPNFALNGTASQNSNYKHSNQPNVDSANFTIDSDFGVDPVNPPTRCAATDTNANVWWKLDLHGNYIITTVAITGRYSKYEYVAARLRGFFYRSRYYGRSHNNCIYTVPF